MTKSKNWVTLFHNFQKQMTFVKNEEAYVIGFWRQKKSRDKINTNLKYSLIFRNGPSHQFPETSDLRQEWRGLLLLLVVSVSWPL